MDNLDYLFAAFAAVWAVIFLFILSLSLKQRKIEREIASLEKQLKGEDE